MTYVFLLIKPHGYTYKSILVSGYTQPNYSLPHCLNGICEAGEDKLEAGTLPTCS